MKKIILASFALSMLAISFSTVSAQESASSRIVSDTTSVHSAKAKGDIIKKGLSFGPLPFVAYDAERGYNMGLILNVYNFGDGSYYPNPKSTLKFCGSYYTGGRKYLQITYDDISLIPGVRLSTGVTGIFDNMLDFYGFNGSQSVLDMTYFKKVDGAVNPNRRFYYMGRIVPSFKADLVGHI
ncbi:MAG: hypothetical protein QMB59_03170, partial [Bacteroidales bacterium]